MKNYGSFKRGLITDRAGFARADRNVGHHFKPCRILSEVQVGMALVESRTVKIPTARAFGPQRKEMTQTIDRDQFPKHLKPVVGQKLQDYQMDGQIINVTVTDISESTVTLDANHPLAGKDLIFDIQLVEIL